jgi:hypothetical protein
LWADTTCVYIGRGCEGQGLPKSDWANPFRISESFPRKGAIGAFKAHLAKAQGLKDRLCELGGKKLACHCPLDLDCHGDVLIEAYKDMYVRTDVPAPSNKDALEAARVRMTKVAAQGPPLLTAPTVVNGVWAAAARRQYA